MRDYDTTANTRVRVKEREGLRAVAKARNRPDSPELGGGISQVGFVLLGWVKPSN